MTEAKSVIVYSKILSIQQLRADGVESAQALSFHQLSFSLLMMLRNHSESGSQSSTKTKETFSKRCVGMDNMCVVASPESVVTSSCRKSREVQ